MAAFVDLLQSDRPVLWLDGSAYAAALLAGGQVPWLEVSAYLAWQRKAQGLLKSDVIALALEPACAAWLEAHAELRAAMAAKRRAVFPLKTLLADEALRAHLVELARGLRASFAGTPLALVLPSPRAWVALAHAQAHGADEELEIGDDEADGAAMYLADFLRAFGDAGVDALLLEERGAGAVTAAQLAPYQPVLNVAGHYRWDTGVLSAGGRLDSAEGFGFAVAPQALAGARAGLVVPPAFWDGGAAPAIAAGAFRFAVIPAAAQPERVLERIAVLRS